MSKQIPRSELVERLSRTVRSVPVTGDDERDEAALQAAVRREFGSPEVPASWLARPVQVPCDVPHAWQSFLPDVYPNERVTSRTVKARLRQLGEPRAERRRAAVAHVSGWPPRPETARALREALQDEDSYVRALAALGVAIHQPDAYGDVLDTAEQTVRATNSDRSETAAGAAALAVLAAFIVARSSDDEAWSARAKVLTQELERRRGFADRARDLAALLESSPRAALPPHG